MDIDLLSKMVKELILDDDKVILPGLGCFVAEIVPAYFSDKGYTINPPYRKLYFRARSEEGDALIDFYAKSNGVSYEAAEKIVKDFISELKAVLHAKKVVVFPGLGRLRATKENNVFFIADEDLDIYPEGFGLEPISLKTVLETGQDSDPSDVQTAEPMNVQSVESTEVQSVESTDVPVVEQEAESVQEQKPATDLEPVRKQEPEPEPEIELLVEPLPAPAKKNKAGRILLITAAVLVLIVAAYMAVGRLCPQWIDQFLYTPEELEIINR